MKNKNLILSMLVFLFSIFLGAAGITARAEETQFRIDAQMLPSDKLTYDVQVTVENLGEDWEGIVRLRVDSRYSTPSDCAYDTVLSLPQGSTKQFAVRLPKNVEPSDGTVTIMLLDKKSNTVAKKEFPGLLQDDADSLCMGILSDAYASLTYLDMGGNEIYFGDGYHPVKLVQLREGSLTMSLDTLTFLVIDSYDTKALTDEETGRIERWMYNGGVLVIGTGSHAEETLGGLDFLEIQYRAADEPDENLYDWNHYVDTSQLSWAELEDTGHVFGGKYSSASFALCGSWGDGAVSVLPCALAEAGKLGTDAYISDKDDEGNTYDTATQESLVEMILVLAADYADSRYQSGSSSYYTDYNLQRIFPALGKGSNRLKFGGLKLLIVLYVVFVGPLLYLILRALKKRDLYWLAVPVAALVGIFLVYWAGRGFEVAHTNVYSVTVESLSGERNAMTYLRCYDAGHKEWSLQMAEGYVYAGPLMNRYYYSDNEDGYYHRVKKEGDRISIGMNPDVGFEDGYFMAGMEKEPEAGTISWDGDGIVTNETQWNFPYFAVIINDKLIVYKDLPAGGSFHLEDSKCEYDDTVATYPYNRSSYTPAEAYFYNYLRDSLRDEDETDIDIKAALGMGISNACFQMEENQVIIIGVTENWRKAVDDDCSEVSYGCLYTVMEEQYAIH